MEKQLTVQSDPWLSEIMGKPAYRLSFPHDYTQQNSTILLEKSSFYFSKISVTQIEAIHTLQNLGSRLVDTNIALDMPIENLELSGNSVVRFTKSDDEDIVAAIARDNFTYTRFHLDPEVSNDVADEIKEEWVRNYYKGKRGDAMVVAEIEGQVVGFLQLIYREQQVIIDLIAVDKNHRRKSIAFDMIAFAMQHKSECSKIIVGTQIANVPSLRLYGRMGFRVCNSNYVFHHHTR